MSSSSTQAWDIQECMKGGESVSIKQMISEVPEDNNCDCSRSGLTVLMIFIINYPTF